ncbi:hypothetical protein NMY22_g8270 [Coprinellus aureogranulatus]|nr:hypothetical protein NMY22_g8270 [Coprinellus aureogranulatus]
MPPPSSAGPSSSMVFTHAHPTQHQQQNPSALRRVSMPNTTAGAGGAYFSTFRAGTSSIDAGGGQMRSPVEGSMPQGQTNARSRSGTPSYVPPQHASSGSSSYPPQQVPYHPQGASMGLGVNASGISPGRMPIIAGAGVSGGPGINQVVVACAQGQEQIYVRLGDVQRRVEDVVRVQEGHGRVLEAVVGPLPPSLLASASVSVSASASIGGGSDGANATPRPESSAGVATSTPSSTTPTPSTGLLHDLIKEVREGRAEMRVSLKAMTTALSELAKSQKETNERVKGVEEGVEELKRRVGEVSPTKTSGAPTVQPAQAMRQFTNTREEPIDVDMDDPAPAASVSASAPLLVSEAQQVTPIPIPSPLQRPVQEQGQEVQEHQREVQEQQPAIILQAQAQGQGQAQSHVVEEEQPEVQVQATPGDPAQGLSVPVSEVHSPATETFEDFDLEYPQSQVESRVKTPDLEPAPPVVQNAGERLEGGMDEEKEKEQQGVQVQNSPTLPIPPPPPTSSNSDRNNTLHRSIHRIRLHPG